MGFVATSTSKSFSSSFLLRRPKRHEPKTSLKSEIEEIDRFLLFLLVLSLLVLVFFPLERGLLDTQTQAREEIEMG